MNPDDEMKPSRVQRSLESEFLAAADPPVKTEQATAQLHSELEALRAEVAGLRLHASTSAKMTKEMEEMRAQFAHMMQRQATEQPKLLAELAELRKHAQAAPQLHVEISQLKEDLRAARAGPAPAPPTPARKNAKVKDILCRKFSGQEIYPGLGAGFENFILEYEQAISTEALLNQSFWTSQIKASVLVNFLDGKAARFFHSNVTQWRIDKPTFNYDDFKSKLRSEFGCKLNQVQLCKRLTSGKRHQDSFSEYLDYLKYVAHLMTGDHSLLLLETFCANACPDLASTLISSIDRSKRNYLQEADRILALLVDLRGDGRKQNQPTRSAKSAESNEKRTNNAFPPKSHPRINGRPKQSPRNGHGQAFTASAKSSSKLVCYVCDQEGHRGPACPELKRLKTTLKQQGQAHNVTASDDMTNSSAETVADTASEAGLWYAASSTVTSTEPRTTEWILDSGATHHMCSDKTLLFGIEEASLKVKVANFATMTATLKGNCVLETVVDGSRRTVLLTDVYFCEALGRNLLSLSQLRRRGLSFYFSDICTFHSPDGTVVGQASERGGLWVVNSTTLGGQNFGAQAHFVDVQTSSLQQWHERLGHINYQDLMKMASKNLADGITLANKKATFCMACAEGKQSRNPQPVQDTSDSAPTDELGAVICMDLKTDLKPDRNGHQHVFTIVDNASNYNQVYLLHTKDEAFDKYLLFANEFQRQYDLRIKVLRTDGGGEFLNSQFSDYAARHGIRLQNTHPNTSASNGKAERFHRTLMNSARAMLWASSLPLRYWGDAVLYASYIRNRVPTRSYAEYKSPLEVLTGKPPRVSHILRFGSKCTVHINNKTGRSLAKQAEKAIVVGISSTQKGYRLLLPRTKRFITSPNIQNVNKLDIRDPETSETLNRLHGEDSQHESQRLQDADISSEQGHQPNSSPEAADSDDEGIPDDYGRPIPAGVLRRMFGRRRPEKPVDFELPKSFFLSICWTSSRAAYN